MNKIIKTKGTIKKSFDRAQNYILSYIRGPCFQIEF